MVKVDLGCGPNKPAGYVGIDVHGWPGVDIVADLTQGIPLEDNSVDELRAYDLIEHLPDRIKTMNEIWRVCKPGALVDIFVPSTDGRGAFQDPTHISYWNENSFRYYYLVDTPSRRTVLDGYGIKAVFRAQELRTTPMTPDFICWVVAKLIVVK